VAPPRRSRLGSARGRTLLGGVLFVLGFAAIFTSYGAAFGALGSILLEHQQTLIRILGVITIVLGLMFTGLLWRIPLAGRSFRLDYRPRAGLVGARWSG
jgi:cytochrome c-type biogenesis protein